MKELLPYLQEWADKGHEFAIATVIQTWGSSPRPVGSTMLVSKDMEMAGSVSGGCVEGAVIREAMPLIENGTAKRLAFGVADEDAWAVGLSCGGKIQVFTERFLAFDPRPEEQAAWALLREKLENNQPCILVSRLEDGQGHHTVLLPDGSAAGQPVAEGLKAEALRAYRERKSQSVEWEGQQFFLQVFPSRSQLLIIGAAHITADLIQLGHLYDFETIVIDPRGVFAHKSKFPQAPDQLIDQYPAEVLNDFTLDAYTYAVVLSHDPKIDDNALHILLPSDIAYIGALGSKKTHAKRVKRLQEAGFSDEAIARIHAPIGLDINAKTPKEIALAIMGEIIGVKNAYL
ncbi:MAG: XdhC family protein [Lewinellaceae bacterium]|nr:XdhC family protein [Phaeodactylibacter sp.]MCB9039231.1 XdhC family protein [Lewinellaceae bacterium]